LTATEVDMPRNSDSQAKLVWQGPWLAETRYDQSDAVSSKGAVYSALKPSTGTEPGTDLGTWELLAKAKPTTPGAELERVKMGLISLGYNHYDVDRRCQ
jgi:hypothetical protein